VSEYNPFLEQLPKKKGNAFVGILQVVVIAVSIGIVLYLFVLTPNQVDGPSMEPNFHTGELLLTNRLTQWIGNTSVGESLGLEYKRGDVVILQKPGLKTFVKRIVGLPGDRISIREGNVYINNEKLNELYIEPTVYTNGGDFLVDGGEGITIPEGSYACIGDNRPVSNDSRYETVGFIKRSWLKGRVILRFYPLGKFTTIATGKSNLI
jgi:signal peptidase I